MRQIVLDTETTGLEPSQGHRIIEIGCVELVNRRLTGRHYHQYIQPNRAVDEGAMEVHGISDEFLKDKPVFAQIAQEFMDFVRGADLIIHNAPFDIGFINHEFAKLKPAYEPVTEHCGVIDTLVMARQKHPGQKNNLDALCKRYGVDNSQRDLHGALLDAEILADVYLLMTGGQTNLSLGGAESGDASSGGAQIRGIQRLNPDRRPLPVVQASADELERHELKLQELGEACVWRS
ncbi:DNA polymerase III subunit epsilon [Aestuariicella hydrocarbonica]|uniref:DNA polymerase III subunit epsilon n=1 Tax=Pseudomaricurvus hydrocarbonicus TaxID=1470433 RepID=A0A9E5JU57_9GAMM|nr:DNA polymerase III subunit epsilon [Aestuariicella hydrocarbonica]NHO65359.1 DNA polymerase III subunit epsilon [Aestuariicella hydrocarbonica]